MRKTLDSLYMVSGGLAAASVVCIAVLVFGQVVFNIIDFVSLRLFERSFGLLIPSYAVLAGYALAFATFLSLALGLRKAVHIRVTLLESRLPTPVRRVTLILVATLGVVLGGMFTYSLAILTYQSYQWGDQGVGLLKIPLWIPQTVILVGVIVFLIAAIDTLIDICRDGTSTALTSENNLEKPLQ
ncbi:TRAP transporter small permease [Pusillimonas sp. ANT_WB101]|nr:TRAP transporter small permease [Pusillimonas sp. ANT_WB101]